MTAGKKKTVVEMGDPKSDDWLPDGWRVEVKVRKNGKRDKFYFPPSGGVRFNSKLEVARYLKNNRPKDEPKERSNHQRSSNKVVIMKAIPEGLPSGWTKEIKVSKKGNKIRRDPFYTDSASGYVFRSMKDALRYIESGEVGRLAFKRKDRENDNVELEDYKTSSPAAAMEQKLEVNGTPSSITSDQSQKSCENANDEMMLNSASTGECATVSKHTSDQCISVAKKQKLEVDGTPGLIISDQILKSCETPKDEQTPNSASTGECTTVSEHTSDQCISVVKTLNLEVNGTPSPIIGDQCLKSCKIAKDEQIRNSASTGEFTNASEHTSNQCGVGTESSSAEFPDDKASNRSEGKSDSIKTLLVEDPSQCILQDNQSSDIKETREESKMTRVKKSRKKKDLNLPRRTSKRLAGVPLDPTPQLKTATRARRAAVELLNETVARIGEQASCDQLDVEQNVKHDTYRSTERPMESNESKHSLAIVEHAGKTGSEEKDDKKNEYASVSPLDNLGIAEHNRLVEASNNADEKPGLSLDPPLEELWRDPCIAFAIKTLTGISPDESDSVKVSSGSSNSEFVGMAAFNELAGKGDGGNWGNLAIPEEHAREVESSNKADEKPGSPLSLPFADAWSDPCIEFAIKTLTGDIPLDFDTVRDYLPHQVRSSQQQESSSLTLPNVGEFCQTEYLCQQFGSSEKPLFNQGALVGPFPLSKSLNHLGYSGGSNRHQCSEERSKNCRR